jgi:hypothetical protein
MEHGGEKYFWYSFSGKIFIGTKIFGNARCEDTIKMDIRNFELIALNSPQVSISIPQFGNMLI